MKVIKSIALAFVFICLSFILIIAVAVFVYMTAKVGEWTIAYMERITA